MKLQRTVFFLTTLLLSTSCPAAGEPLTELNFVHAGMGVWNARVGNKQFIYNDPDSELWESGLTVRDLKTQKLCSTGISLVTAVYFYDSRLAIVKHYSGSTTFIDFIDLETCKEKYPGISAYTKGVEVRRDRITIQPGCEEGGSHIFQCSSASIYALKQAGQPVLLKRESAILTHKILGVGFVGIRYVHKPETPEAKFFAATASTWMPRIALSTQEPSVHHLQVGDRELTVSHPADGFLDIFSSLTITDKRNSHTCHIRTWSVREIYPLPNTDVLMFLSHAYKKSFIGFLDVTTCKEKFPRIEFNQFTIIEILRDRIAIPPACKEADEDNKSVRQCEAARIYGFDPSHRPILLEHESNMLTRQITGVEFSGDRSVENLGTKHAKLLPEKEGWFLSIKNWFTP